MDGKLQSKLVEDDIDDMKLEIEDRDGQLLQLQQEEADVQASMNGDPKAFTLQGYYYRTDLTLAMVPIPVRGKMLLMRG